MTEDKTRDSRVRRLANREGLRVVRSRCRVPEAAEYGTYMITDPFTNSVVAIGLSGGFGLTLDDVENYLSERQEAGR